MKKILSVFLSAVIMLSCISAASISVQAADYRTLATTLSLNAQWSGEYWITSTVTEKWFKINIPSDGKFTLKLMAYKNRSNTYIYNYDLSQTIMGDPWFAEDGRDIQPSTDTYTVDLSAGTYYMKTAGDEGKFKVYADFKSFGANDFGADSYERPFSLKMKSEITGAITRQDQEDWYKIQVPTSGPYIFKLTAYKNRSDAYIYNYDLSQTIMDGWYFASGGSEAIPCTKTAKYTLSPGIYYIKTAGDTGKYKLAWYALTPENCTHEYYTSNAYATYFAKGYTQYVCKHCGYTFKGNYTSKKQLSTPYYLYTDTKNLKKAIKVSFWSVYDATGYQIQYSTDKNMKKGVKILSTKSTRKTIKSLKSKKKYYVRVRAYISKNGKKAYSKWTSKKSAKTR